MFWWMLLSAVLASALTIAVAVMYYDRVAEPRLRASLEEIGRDLGEDIEQRVRSGVRAGIEDAASAETLVRATKKATRTGASLFEDGINVLLGGPKRKN